MASDSVPGEAHRGATPRAVVVVCTRDRGDLIVGTIESILDNPNTDVEVIVIDQSRDHETRDALARFAELDRVRYIASGLPGLSRARNLALASTDAELVLSTDDDCVVDARWIDANLAVFDEYPEAAIVFGDVVAPPEGLGGEGYAPENVAHDDFIVRSVRGWKSPDGINVGIGASMAVRKSVVDELGGYDELLGAGAELKSAEDTDMSLRALFAGHAVVHCTEVQVVHFGRRSHEEFRGLVRESMFSLGAVIGKLVRVHPGAMTWFAVGRIGRLIVTPVVTDLPRLRRPPVLGRAVYLARGIWLGLRRATDGETHRFLVPEPSE